MPPPDRPETHPPKNPAPPKPQPGSLPQNSNCGSAYKSDKKNPPDPQTIPPILCVSDILPLLNLAYWRSQDPQPFRGNSTLNVDPFPTTLTYINPPLVQRHDVIARRRTQPRAPTAGTKPHMAPAIFKNRPHAIGSQTIGGNKRPKILAVKAAYPTQCGNPDIAVATLNDMPHPR